MEQLEFLWAPDILWWAFHPGEFHGPFRTAPEETHGGVGHGGCAAINPRYRMNGYWYPNHVRWLTALKRRDERRKAIEKRDKND